MFTKFASYKVPPVMVSTHGSVVPLAMFFFSRGGVGVFLVKPKCLIYVNVRMIVHSA